ncbi:MAG: outer membrane protein assembly factor BamA, partial [Candidatus Omnitrophota bacterium]
EKKGFNEAVIDYRVEVIEGTNKANVTFVAVENFRFKIRGVFFQGNKSFPAKRLMKVIKTRWAWMFNAGALKDDVLVEDMERLKSFYQREGFADVKASYSISREPKKRAIYVNVLIDEGKKYLVGDVKLEGCLEVAEKDIRAKMKDCTSGKVFSQDALKDEVANIHSVYFDRGYIFASIDNVTSVNPQTGNVDILYSIVENNIAYVDKIKIKGNIKTKDIVVRRELRIHPGDKFDGEKLRRSKERLQNLGFFDEVSYDTEDAGAPDKRDLVVEVKEAKTGSFSFGGGYSTIDSFMGFAEIEQKNFDWRNWPYFTGDGQDLRLRVKIGTVSDEYIASWTDPWIFDYPLAFGIDAFRRRHDRDTDIGYGYNEIRTGGDLRLNKEITEYLAGLMMYRYEIIEISEIPTTATEDFQKEAGRNAISSTMFGLTYDRRDNVFNPTRGYLLSGTFEVAGGPFGGDKDFRRFIGSGSKFFPLFYGSVIEFTGRIGVAEPFGDSEEIPIYERFFAGGGDSIRGYEERKVGPFDPITKDPLGGNSMMLGTVEYTYPLFSFFKLAAFMDTGNVWEKADDLASGGFKSAVGFGIRVKTPMGPVKVDYGIPMNKQPGETKRSNGRFNFSVGSGF